MLRRKTSVAAFAVVFIAGLFPGATVANPPEIRVDAPTVEATDSAGADASYHVKSYNPDTGTPTDATCDIPGGTAGSGDFDAPTFHYPLGSTTVTCTATVSGASGSAQVVVQDTTPPTLTLPADISVDATGPTVVNYAEPTANDLVDGSVTPTCSNHSGDTFPVGTTTVSCTAEDSHGNSASGSFTVTVNAPSDQPPTLSLPSDLTVHTTDPSGAQVTYTATASDAEDGALSPSCSPASGSVFSVGTTTVSCSVTDSAGHTVTGTFSVTVILDSPPPPSDTTPPVLSNVPQDVRVEANSPAGSVVHFSSPTATDNVDGPIANVACAPASGATFPLGTTTVTCSATDSSGNTGSASFPVSVVDTTPPHLIPPGDRSVYATTPAGIYDADEAANAFLGGYTVFDLADPHPTVTNDAPNFFLVGVTVVTFTARDASGNTSTAQARLDVRPMPEAGTTPPPLPPPTDRTPPGDVTDVVVTSGDGVVTLTWVNPKASDFDHVEIVRSTTSVGSATQVVYSGSATSFRDKLVLNGIEYRYVIKAVDKAGNDSAGVVAVAFPKASGLLSPKAGARVKKTVKFTWRKVKSAKYYNLQAFYGGTRVFAATADAKVLSVWPTKASFVLKKTWKYAGRKRTLKPGVYTWYVWPGFGPRSAAEYGELIGSRSFTVVR